MFQKPWATDFAFRDDSQYWVQKKRFKSFLHILFYKTCIIMVLTYFHGVARSWTWLSDWTELNMILPLKMSMFYLLFFFIKSLFNCCKLKHYKNFSVIKTYISSELTKPMLFFSVWVGMIFSLLSLPIFLCICNKERCMNAARNHLRTSRKVS